MYSIYSHLSHLTNLDTEKSLTSFILLDCAVGFDSFLALLLFGKDGAQASRRQMKEWGEWHRWTNWEDEIKRGADRQNHFGFCKLNRTGVERIADSGCSISTSRARRQAGGSTVRTTDSWREWCSGKDRFHYISPPAGAPVSSGTFPREAAPWLDSQLLHQHCWPRASICSPDLLACTQTHTLARWDTHRIDTYMYICGHTHTGPGMKEESAHHPEAPCHFCRCGFFSLQLVGWQLKYSGEENSAQGSNELWLYLPTLSEFLTQRPFVPTSTTINCTISSSSNWNIIFIDSDCIRCVAGGCTHHIYPHFRTDLPKTPSLLTSHEVIRPLMMQPGQLCARPQRQTTRGHYINTVINTWKCSKWVQSNPKQSYASYPNHFALNWSD